MLVSVSVLVSLVFLEREVRVRLAAVRSSCVRSTTVGWGTISSSVSRKTLRHGPMDHDRYRIPHPSMEYHVFHGLCDIKN